MGHKNVPDKALIICVSTKSKSLLHDYLVSDMQYTRVLNGIFGPKFITFSIGSIPATASLFTIISK